MQSRRGLGCELWFYGFKEQRAVGTHGASRVVHIVRVASAQYHKGTRLWPCAITRSKDTRWFKRPPPRLHDQHTSLPQRRTFGAANAVDARTVSLPSIGGRILTCWSLGTRSVTASMVRSTLRRYAYYSGRCSAQLRLRLPDGNSSSAQQNSRIAYWMAAAAAAQLSSRFAY